MATYPYISSISSLERLVQQLRRNFPKKLNANILKALQIAPNNESYAINIIRFLGLIDKEGQQLTEKAGIFLKQEEDFRVELARLVSEAYSELFDLYQEDAWSLDKLKLVAFFREQDKSSDLVGTRQADTFLKLAEISGKREATQNSQRRPRMSSRPTSKSVQHEDKAQQPALLQVQSQANLPSQEPTTGELSLSVKIEVNLPASSDQAVYDAIFRSIRQNLMGRE